MPDYGRAGLIGVLTPQANTTVEPEFWCLLPPDCSMLNARLVSQRDTIEGRLIDYTTKFASTSDQFANAPVDVIAAACTGASYLIGAEQEARIVAQVEARRGVPFLTAALASVAALRSLGAQRIALLTPYPDSLNDASTRYWEGHGFQVVAKSGPALETEAFHPIYAMSGTGVLAAHERLAQSGADAVLMLGTGMATLRPLLEGHKRGYPPALSCNLALAWAATQALGAAIQLPDWLSGRHWAPRLDLLFPTDP
jgi:maleate cis-trans isomerase